jgi:hypothetical protein
MRQTATAMVRLITNTIRVMYQGMAGIMSSSFPCEFAAGVLVL